MCNAIVGDWERRHSDRVMRLTVPSWKAAAAAFPLATGVFPPSMSLLLTHITNVRCCETKNGERFAYWDSRSRRAGISEPAKVMVRF